MKKLLLLALLLVFIKNLCAQAPDFDSKMKRQYVACDDIWLNAMDLVPRYHAAGQTDSLLLFIDYWEKKCGSRDYILRLKALAQIKSNTFDPAFINRDLFNALRNYKSVINDTLGYFGNKQELYGYYENDRLIYITRTIAQSIPTEGLEADARFIVEFLGAHKPVFEALRTEKYKDARLTIFYNEQIRIMKNKAYPNIGIIGGYFQPTGKLSFAGGKALIGFVMGINQGRNNYNLEASGVLSDSSRAYTVNYRDSLISTRCFHVFHIGLGYSYNIVQTRSFDLGVLSGIGYNGLTAVDSDSRRNINAKTFNSLNLNGGLGFKFKIGQVGYIGLEGRYNYVDFKNDPGGTNLSGDYITVRLIAGMQLNMEKGGFLRQMQ